MLAESAQRWPAINNEIDQRYDPIDCMHPIDVERRRTPITHSCIIINNNIYISRCVHATPFSELFVAIELML